MKLPREQEKILYVLTDECKRNPKTSLIGLDLKLLGEKVGAYLGIAVRYDVDKLRRSGFVSRDSNKVIITQKGLDYVNSQRRQKYYWLIAFLLIMGIIASIYTDNFLYFILSVFSSIIAGIIVYIITKSHSD